VGIVLGRRVGSLFRLNNLSRPVKLENALEKTYTESVNDVI
jgi:hypothetical protein